MDLGTKSTGALLGERIAILFQLGIKLFEHTKDSPTKWKFMKAQKGLCSRLLQITSNLAPEILRTEHGKIFRRSIVLALSFGMARDFLAKLMVWRWTSHSFLQPLPLNGINGDPPNPPGRPCRNCLTWSYLRRSSV
uniref:Uncharacterized protein n=1 Tax=Opuntia streptacantha TaxID=393608 RepID=A0A7C9DDD0_OPUST